MNKDQIIKERDLIIDQIKEYVPMFKPFFEMEISLREYSKNLRNVNINQIQMKRQELIKKKIQSKLQKLYGQDYQKNLHLNLRHPLSFNIVDHHQVMNHPLLIGDYIISDAAKFLQDGKQEAIIVISSGDIPPNSYFSKNGFQLHGKNVPLFSNSERESSFYFLPKREFDPANRLKMINRWEEFNKEEQDFLIKEQERFNSYDYSKCECYNDQISVAVKNTFPLLFEKNMRNNIPALLYITQEELTTDCLIEILNEDNIITECLFNPEFRQTVLDNFRGIVTTWREKENKGTHFFWRKYPGKPKSLRMWIEGDKLVPDDPRFKEYTVDLDKNTIISLLKQKEIYPSLFLIFSVLNFYSGAKPLVGYGSVIYLDYFKKAWLKTLEDSKFENEIPLINSVDTDGLIAFVPIFFKRIGERLKTLYAEDIIFEGGMLKSYISQILDMKVRDLAVVAAADMYDYLSFKYVPENKRIRRTINFDDLAEITLDI